MLRSDIIEGTNRLSAALEIAGIEKALDGIMDAIRHRGPDRSAIDADALLVAFQKYQHEYTRFSPVEHQLADIFDIASLSDPKWWAQLLAKDQFDHIIVYEMQESVRFCLRFLPKIIRMLDREMPAVKLSIDSDQNNIFSIFLIDESRNLSSPERVIMAISAVNKLYEACARLEKEPVNSISVTACDSGSEKSFDFLGIAKVFESVRGVVSDLWDRIVFYREHKLDRRLDLIIKSIPIIEKVSDMEKNGQCDPEEGAIIKKKVIDGISEFVHAGVMTREIMTRANISPRELMAPQPKLLTQSVSVEEETGADQRTVEDLKKFEDVLKGLSKEERDAWLRGLDDASSHED